MRSNVEGNIPQTDNVWQYASRPRLVPQKQAKVTTGSGVYGELVREPKLPSGNNPTLRQKLQSLAK
jgi:hypothetical protein